MSGKTVIVGGEDVPFRTFLLLMAEACQYLTPRQRAALEKWETANRDGYSVGTSEWPGWAKIITAVPPGFDKKMRARGPRAGGGRPTPKARIPSTLRWEVWERDNFTCLHCGARRHLSVDHILPESRGGQLVLSNLQTLCKPCNSKKGARL